MTRAPGPRPAARSVGVLAGKGGLVAGRHGGPLAYVLCVVCPPDVASRDRSPRRVLPRILNRRAVVWCGDFPAPRQPGNHHHVSRDAPRPAARRVLIDSASRRPVPLASSVANGQPVTRCPTRSTARASSVPTTARRSAPRPDPSTRSTGLQARGQEGSDSPSTLPIRMDKEKRQPSGGERVGREAVARKVVPRRSGDAER